MHIITDSLRCMVEDKRIQLNAFVVNFLPLVIWWCRWKHLHRHLQAAAVGSLIIAIPASEEFQDILGVDDFHMILTVAEVDFKRQQFN